MSGATCYTTREAAAEFALGIVTGSDRADFLMHLNGCAPCQAIVDEYATAADALLNLVPEAEPVADLTEPVLRRIRPRRHARRRRVLAAAAAAVLTVAAAGGLLAVERTRTTGNPRDGVTSALRSTPMLASNGVAVGHVVATHDNRPAIAVNVDYWLSDGRYRVEIQRQGKTATDVGTIDIEHGRGSWTGRVPSGTHALSIALVDGSGNRVCNGRLA